MKIAFIGAGKVGISLGRFFVYKGLKVTGYYSPNPLHREYAAKETNTKNFEDIESVVYDNDIIFLTVSDDKIDLVAKKLTNCEDKIIINTSGVHSSFMPVTAYACVSMHPPIPFPNANVDVKLLDMLTFVIEANGIGAEKLYNLLYVHNIKYLKISPEKKPIYHAAACILSNYITTLIYEGQALLKSIGIDDGIFNQLMVQNFNNVLEKGALDALTGPIVRGDIGTIKTHLDALPKEYLHLYKALATKTVDMAKLDETTKIKFKDMLI